MNTLASRLSGQCRVPKGLLPEVFRQARLAFALPTPANSAMDKQRENGALLISACFIAAIRLRGEPIQQSPKVVATVPYSLPEWCCSDLGRD